MVQIINIENEKGGMMTNAMIWSPNTQGPELAGFLGAIGRPVNVQQRLLQESEGILGGCIQPTVGGRNVGLILGRVQSGKTSSFTAVSALAHDNGYRLIIVIAGTTQLLVDQTTVRLKGDLRLDENDAFRRWTICAISDKDKPTASAAQDNLKQRLRAITADHKPLFAGIPIVVVMKNTVHLERLNKLLQDLHTVDGVDFDKLPTLVIDDEAHMHTPDVGKEESPSAVYQSIRDLADKFPRRSLLQYTATPQANLLMEIADELSPDFVRILEPGDGYVGGKEIFDKLPNPKVRDIGPNEIGINPSKTDPCPKSLQSATANFLLVCALDFVEDGVANARSMLIHSDAKVSVHDVYEHWVKTLCETWQIMLADKKIATPKVFTDEFEDLKRTRPELNEERFNLDQIREVLVQILLNLRIQSVNHKSDVGKVDFNLSPYWIVNGGNILGVGYTVVGLVTTHMVRKPGVGMADTIQQRGRFFGYLNDRLKSVRVFISNTMAKRFQDYTAHEEGLRQSLKKYDATQPEYDSVNKPTLKDWKRVFWLDPAMQPTRKQAQRLMLERIRTEKDGWIAQKRPSPSVEIDIENLRLASEFVSVINDDANTGWQLSNQWGGVIGNESTTHLESQVPLAKIIEIVSNLTLSANDRARFDAAVLAIHETHADLEHQNGLVILIARGANQSFRRTRSEPVVLFQGRGDGKGGYVGDGKVRDQNAVTLQIHLLNIVDSDNPRRVIRQDMTAIALSLPSNAATWIQNVLLQP